MLKQISLNSFSTLLYQKIRKNGREYFPKFHSLVLRIMHNIFSLFAIANPYLRFLNLIY